MEQQQQYVGIDLHRRRSVIVRRTPDGETLETVRIDNDPLVLAAELAKAGEHPEVVLEATYGLGLPRFDGQVDYAASRRGCGWICCSYSTGVR